MGRPEIVVDEYYHLLNRSVDGRTIFKDTRDWARFLFLILYFQSPTTMNNIGHHITRFIKHRTFNIKREATEEIIKERYVELISFAIMPNHFHLLVLEKKEGGTAKYMQRVLDAYTKYNNIKYHRVGHLFQGRYKAVLVENNRQLIYLSTYIHKNPSGVLGWRGREDEYLWSSYKDYIRSNRWGGLLKTDFILSQFKDPNEYEEEVTTSTAKEGDKSIKH